MQFVEFKRANGWCELVRRLDKKPFGTAGSNNSRLRRKCALYTIKQELCTLMHNEKGWHRDE